MHTISRKCFSRSPTLPSLLPLGYLFVNLLFNFFIIQLNSKYNEGLRDWPNMLIQSILQFLNHLALTKFGRCGKYTIDMAALCQYTIAA